MGETVLVVRSHSEDACRFIGSAGLLLEDDESDNPFYVRLPFTRTRTLTRAGWCACYDHTYYGHTYSAAGALQ